MVEATFSELLHTGVFVGGKWVLGDETFVVRDPATGAEVANVYMASNDHVTLALAGAELAGKSWAALPAISRGKILSEWYRLVVVHRSSLAELLTLEQGKPIAEARAEVDYAAGFIEWFAEEARRAYGETIPSRDPSVQYMVIKRPVGVCAAITPWNFPAAMVTRKLAPALAAGCPVILKPAEQAPLTAAALVDLARQAGVPAGVLSLLPADRTRSIKIGALLCESPIVRHLSFTGSTSVGRTLMKQCASTLKRLSLELGGNAPFIVFEDANLKRAVDGVLAAKFRNAGQTCVSPNRFYVHESVHDEFVALLKERVEGLKLGIGTDESVRIGPLIDDLALQKVCSHIEDALSGGARLVTGGSLVGSTHIRPTILTQVQDSMRCVREETFGPLVAIQSFREEAEVLSASNASEFGLAAYLYTRDLSRAWRLSRDIECGMLGVNTGVISAPEIPFGGVKQSGFGREGSHHGLDDYLELKLVCFGGLDA